VGYSLRILASARRELERLPAVAQQDVRHAIRGLAHDPRSPGARILSGAGAERIWRIRKGDYRVLYEVDDDRPVVLVIRIAHRREVYR